MMPGMCRIQYNFYGFGSRTRAWETCPPNPKPVLFACFLGPSPTRNVQARRTPITAADSPLLRRGGSAGSGTPPPATVSVPPAGSVVPLLAEPLEALCQPSHQPKPWSQCPVVEIQRAPLARAAATATAAVPPSLDAALVIAAVPPLMARALPVPFQLCSPPPEPQCHLCLF